MTGGEWTATLITASVMGFGCIVAYWQGFANGKQEAILENARHNRGIRGFDRPAPRTAETESVVRIADWRNRAEGFDM